MKRRGPKKAAQTEIRIIGGEWRGRKLPVPDVSGLRPTPSRIRETLFNWLQPVISGATCLDLYAGTGALGIEALSRGAAAVTFWERDAEAASQLRQSVEQLGADQAAVHSSDALVWLQRNEPSAADIVFVDPPFADGLHSKTLQALNNGWLKPGSRVYLEMPAKQTPELPEGWELARSKQAGDVGYHLAIVC